MTKQIKFILSSRLVNMEHQCWANAQYSRVIIGIPRDVEANVLKVKVVKTFENLGCSISPNHIEARHRVSHRQLFTQEGLLARFDCEKGSTEKNGRC